MKLEQVAKQLQKGEVVTFKPKGNSMSPRIKSGQEVTLIPVGYVPPPEDKPIGGGNLLGLTEDVFSNNRRTVYPQGLRKDNVVLAKVRGSLFLHKITAIDHKKRRVQIGNNKGQINGWTSFDKVYGFYDDVKAGYLGV